MACDRETQAPVGDLSKETALPKPSTTLNVHASSWVGNSISSGVQVALQTALVCVNSEREESKSTRFLFYKKKVYKKMRLKSSKS